MQTSLDAMPPAEPRPEELRQELKPQQRETLQEMEPLDIPPQDDKEQEMENEEVEVQERKNRDEKDEETLPLELEVWCLIVGMIGTAFPVIVKRTGRVWELQKTIKNEAVEIFGDFNAAQLRLYLAKADNGQWLSPAVAKAIENGDTDSARHLLARGHLASMSQLAEVFKNMGSNAVHVLVLAPAKPAEIEMEPDIVGKRKRSEQSIGDAETTEVPAGELKTLFDALVQKTRIESTLVQTRTLHEFLKGFGGFPPSLFVRKEVLVLWGLVMRILSKREKRIVIVGSAGVGKSCFLLLAGFYLAVVEKKKVLVIRRLKGFSETSAVVYLDGEKNSCIRKANMTAAKISSLPDRNEFEGALILVDGYSRKELKRLFGLLPFQLLASSMEDEVNFDDSVCELVLPGWRYSDLLGYAESNPDEWKQSTGLEQENQKSIAELVGAQYFYSGGNIRNFRKNREVIKYAIDAICGMVENAQTVDLESLHQGGLQVSESFDRIQRYYIIDTSDEEHYMQVRHWRIQMDSGYAFKRIGHFMDCEKHFGYYEFAHKTRAGFCGAAYEQTFHSAVRQATTWYSVQMMNVVINFDPSYSNQRYDWVELRGQSVECEGKTEDECYQYLTKFAPGTYWHPDCTDFPFIDAVVVCEATLRGSTIKETIVACIGTTVSDSKIFQPHHWKKLNEALDENDSVSSFPRLYVLVGPDISTCKQITLVDAPAPDKFMVCCFDPLKFPRKPAPAI
ncbi:unnamed protein product [Phytophthora fragariaefolia]|uniref:Unnamed protein product n=1 Tax=Phytophthora fragariaefolia TaxID=1490495 RepID=A0A9W6X8Y8_9STRA|nr:unnamed protein product [Phytophthora fragariaefolia]